MSENAERYLFIRHDKVTDEFVLSGKQRLGRAVTDGAAPDIGISAPFISRDHGTFETDGDKVTFTAAKTISGIYLNTALLVPGRTVDLKDGDELTIPSGGNGSDVLITCAFSKDRIDRWKSMMSK